MSSSGNRRQRRRAMRANRALSRDRRATRRIVVGVGIVAVLFLGARAMAESAPDPGAPPAAAPVKAGSPDQATSATDGASWRDVWTEAALRELVRTAIDEHEIPAMAVATVGRDGILAQASVGRRARDMAVEVEATDLWHIGSCTKALTATLLASLVADGSLGWNMTLEEFAAATGMTVPEPMRPVTLESMLAMRGGIPGSPPPMAWMKAWDDARQSQIPWREQRERFVASVLAGPFGTPGRFEYSNQAYVIAGLAAERALDEQFETLVLERLARPLGMTSLGFGAPETADTLLQQPRGHRDDGTPVMPEIGSDNPPVLSAAGRVHLSLGDWARFVQAHLRGPAHGSEALGLDATSFRHLHRPRGEDGHRYALGWISNVDADFGSTLWHNGSNTMWYAEMWLAPEHELAVIIVCNRGMPAGERAVAATREAIIGPLRERLRVHRAAAR